MFLFVLSGLLRIVFTQPLQNSSNSNDTQFLTNYFDIHNQLIDKLFKTYKKELPAVYLSGRYDRISRPIQVNVTLMYYRLLAIDQAKQSSQIIADLYYEWTDSRLTWNPADYSGIDEIAVVNKDTVWVPDVLPFDTFSFSYTLPQEMQTVNIRNDGTMTTYTTTVIDFICHMNLKKYPFDDQTCELQLSSFNYPSLEMIVVGLIGFNFSDLANAGNGEWNMMNITVDNSIYSYGQEDRVYSNPIFYFIMKRSTNYYILLLITPSFILTVLCVFGLFWAPVRADHYMESLNLGFAAILALMFVLQTGTQDMPKIDETDKLSIYLLSNLVLLTVAIGMVMVLGKFARNYCHKGKKDSKTYAFMKNYVYEYLHLFLMVTFSLAAVINLLVLLK